MENCDWESEELLKLKAAAVFRFSVPVRWIMALWWMWLMLYLLEAPSTFTIIQGISCCLFLVWTKNVSIATFMLTSRPISLGMWNLRFWSLVYRGWSSIPYQSFTYPEKKKKILNKSKLSLRCSPTAWKYSVEKVIIEKVPSYVFLCMTETIFSKYLFVIC